MSERRCERVTPKPVQGETRPGEARQQFVVVVPVRTIELLARLIAAGWRRQAIRGAARLAERAAAAGEDRGRMSSEGPSAAAREAIAALARARLPISSEKELQAAIGCVLDAAGIAYEREKPVAGGVIDLWLPSLVGIEVKITGAAREIFTQLARYAAEPLIEHLVLVTSRPMRLPPLIAGKPASTLDLGRAWL